MIPNYINEAQARRQLGLALQYEEFDSEEIIKGLGYTCPIANLLTSGWLGQIPPLAWETENEIDIPLTLCLTGEPYFPEPTISTFTKKALTTHEELNYGILYAIIQQNGVELPKELAWQPLFDLN